MAEEYVKTKIERVRYLFKFETLSSYTAISEITFASQLPPVETGGLQTATRDQTVDQEARNCSSVTGYKNGRVFPWLCPLPGTPNPTYPSRY